MEGVRFAPLGRQEVVQLFVESKLDRTFMWGVFHIGYTRGGMRVASVGVTGGGPKIRLG